MKVTAYLNDAAGGSFARRSEHSAASHVRATRSLDEGREHIPYCDGYEAELAHLVPSMLPPFEYDDTTEMLDALSLVYMSMNADERPNGQFERSLSVGDVLKIEHDGLVTWHAIERIGFTPIPEPKGV